MMYPELFENPWAPGCAYDDRDTLLQGPPGTNTDSRLDNGYWNPKTQQQIKEEGLVQLAILAAVVVAPALLGKLGAAKAAGMGTAAEAPGAVIATQGAMGNGA